MEKKDKRLDSSLLVKLLKTPKRKITDSTLTQYLKRSKPSILNKTQKSGFSKYERSNKSTSPMFADSIKVQKIKLITHREAFFMNHAREVAALTERCCSIKNCNCTAHSFRTSLTGFQQQNANQTKLTPQMFKLKYLSIPRISKNLQKITVKEASKDGEWSFKAKPEVEKLWRAIINKSNGVELVNVGNFKVFVGKGNNSQLVKKIFMTRPWWSLTESVKSADFVWTQWKSEEIFAGLDKGVELTAVRKSTLPSSNFCPINIKGEDNLFKIVTIEELNYQLIRNSPSYTHVEIFPKPSLGKIYNKIEGNECLTDKKGLFYTMTKYYESVNQDPFSFIPMTFHVTSEKDSNFSAFRTYFQSLETQKQPKMQNLWIVKPAEKSNRGQGISICNSISQIQLILSCKDSNKSYILQKYIERPFLINKRKFDFRCFALLTSINSVIQGYFYTEGYLRTASSEFSTKDIADNFKHLTNDAIQKYGENYGKYEDGNKLSYREFQRYLDTHHDKKVNFYKEILPELKKLVKDTFLASFFKIDPAKRLNCMEILGYDFMLDSNIKPWLNGINTDLCLETSCSILNVLIPAMLENSLKIAVDPIFTPNITRASDSFIENKFELIFHELTDGEVRKQTLKTTANICE